MVFINTIDSEFWQMIVFDTSTNVWSELLCLDFSSLVLQARLLHNVEVLHYLN
jgi:hypothetical protein